MKKILISLIAAVASVGMVAYGAPSTVASYAAPNLVSEINTALANPTHNNLIVSTNLTVGGAVTSASARVNGILSLANGEYFVNDQDTYMKCSGHLVSLGNGTFNLGSSTQQWNYLYLLNDAAMEALVVRDDATFGTNVTCSALTASKPVFTDGSKVLISKTINNVDVALTSSVTPQVVTLTATPTLKTGTVTASGANNLVTPTATMTPETGAITASGANDLITPTATVTPQVVTPTATPTLQTGAVTASGANNLVTPTITVTIQTTTGYDSTGAAITNAAGETVAMMTNATATCSPDLASNAVVVVTVTGGDAVMTNLTIAVTPDLMTNATCAITPDLASNAVVAISVTGGGAVWTNATCAITPDLASNDVVAVTVTGGGAVMTNLTIAVTPDAMTNAVVTTP